MTEIAPIEGEVWKDIPGFYNYRVSNMGRFMRLKPNGNHRLLHGKIDRVGYQQIGLMDATHTQRWFLAHRIVACTFSPPVSLQDHENTFLTVNHKNRIKTDNRFVNLELVTVTDNHRHWRKTKLSKMAGV